MSAYTGAVLALAGFVASAAATFVLARIAPRTRLVDDGSDAPARKAQRAPVPLVGGTAILAAVCLTLVLSTAWRGGALPWSLASEILPGFRLHYGWALGAALAAYGVGLVDDLAARGLAPAAKLAAQAVPAALVAASRLALAPEDVAGALAIGAATIVAQNALNFFDHADGVAASSAFLGLCWSTLGHQGAVLGFWTWNVAPRTGAGTPRAYLGDSGSHLLAVLLLVHPLGLAGLLLPAADLVRVVQERIAEGRRPWIGDRRHLGHLLQSLGLAPLHVSLVAFALGLAPVACAVLIPGTGLIVGGIVAFLEVRLVAARAAGRSRP